VAPTSPGPSCGEPLVRGRCSTRLGAADTCPLGSIAMVLRLPSPMLARSGRLPSHPLRVEVRRVPRDRRRCGGFRAEELESSKHEKTSQTKIGRRPRPSGRQAAPPHRPARRVDDCCRRAPLKRGDPAFYGDPVARIAASAGEGRALDSPLVGCVGHTGQAERPGSQPIFDSCRVRGLTENA
jgi:hypothetical protein